MASLSDCIATVYLLNENNKPIEIIEKKCVKQAVKKLKENKYIRNNLKSYKAFILELNKIFGDELTSRNKIKDSWIQKHKQVKEIIK